MYGCDTLVRFAQLAAEEVRTGISFLATLVGEDLKKCGMPDVFAFFEVLYFMAAAREMRFLRRVFRCLCLQFLCEVGVWVVLLTCYSFYGRSDVVGRKAVGDVEQLLERP